MMYGSFLKILQNFVFTAFQKSLSRDKVTPNPQFIMRSNKKLFDRMFPILASWLKNSIPLRYYRIQ